MARPPNPQAQSHARKVLVDAALELVERGGFEALTMRELAKAAGVSHQTPNHHFRSKDGLLDELAARGFVELDRDLGDALAAASDDPRDQLLALSMGYLIFALRRPALFRLLFRPGRASVPASLASAQAAVTRRFGGTLARLHDAGEHEAEVQLDAVLAVSTVHGLATQLVDPIAPPTDPSALARAVSTRLAALFPPPRPRRKP